MRALGIADVHLSPLNVKSLLFRISHVCDIARTRKIRNIFQYGDLVNNEDLTVLRKLRRLFKEYPDLNFWIIAGNHDLLNNRGFTTCCLDVLNAPNVRVFSRRAEVVCIDGTRVNFNPWPHARLMFNTLNVVHAAVPEVAKKLDYAFYVDMKKCDAVTVAGHLHSELRVRNTFYAGILNNNSDPAFHYINYKSDSQWKIEKCNLFGYSNETPISPILVGKKKPKSSTSKPKVSKVSKTKSTKIKATGFFHKVRSMEDLLNIPEGAGTLQVESVFKVKHFSAPNVKRVRIPAGYSLEAQQELRATANKVARMLDISYSGKTKETK